MSSATETQPDQSVRSQASRRRLRLAYMTLARRLDLRFEALRLSGGLSKWYSSVGNEATTVAAGLELQRGDVLCSLHRDLGAILAYYLDPVRTFPELGFEELGRDIERRPEPRALLRRLTCQLMGKDEGFSRGIERSFHYGLIDLDRDLLHVGMISHLGSMIPVAAGCAFARARGFGGEGRGVAINFIGDGGTSTGDFHEGLNMAAVWSLPLVLVIENNRYAFSTPVAQQYRANQLSDRGPGYGIPSTTVDGNDPDAVAAVLADGIEFARSGRGPVLIEAMLPRLRGHSEGDDSLKVVPADELADYQRSDGFGAYWHRLRSEGVVSDDFQASIEARCSELVEDAVDYAIAADPPDPRTAFRPVFAVSSPRPESSAGHRADATGSDDMSEILYVDAIQRALTDELETDPTTILMGQDIGVFEGAFRVTRDLHSTWSERVLDTPIAESGTVGIAIGAALLGMRPVVEMQFADFVSCCFNQLVNVAAKLYYRFERPCPITVRLPSGGGVGAGAFHSQNPEGWFAHTAGLKVVCPATAEDAYGLLRAAIRDPNPVIFCEHKYLYRRIRTRHPLSIGALGVAQRLREGSDVTLIGYGASTWTCVDAADRLAERGVSADVIDLRTLVPLDEDTVLESVRRTGRALVVHEAQETGGFGGEVAARIGEQAFAWLDAPVRRLAYPDRPVPYVKALERELLPNADRVLAAAEELLAY